MTAIPSAELTADDSKQLDDALTALEAGAAKWAALNQRDRAALLEKTHDATAAAARAWAEAAIAAKKVPAGALEGEEWMSGPYATLGGLQSVAQSMRKLTRRAAEQAMRKTHGSQNFLGRRPLSSRRRGLRKGSRADRIRPSSIDRPTGMPLIRKIRSLQPKLPTGSFRSKSVGPVTIARETIPTSVTSTTNISAR